MPEFGAASFVAATGKASGDDTAKLMAQLQKACSAAFDAVAYEQDDAGNWEAWQTAIPKSLALFRSAFGTRG